MVFQRNRSQPWRHRAIVLWLGTAEPVTLEQKRLHIITMLATQHPQVELLGILSQGTQRPRGARVMAPPGRLLPGGTGRATLHVRWSSAPGAPDCQHAVDGGWGDDTYDIINYSQGRQDNFSIFLYIQAVWPKDSVFLALNRTVLPGVQRWGVASPRVLHEVCQHCRGGYKNPFSLFEWTEW